MTTGSLRRRPVKVRTLFLSISISATSMRGYGSCRSFSRESMRAHCAGRRHHRRPELGQRLFWTASTPTSCGHCWPSGAQAPGSSTFPATTTRASQCLPKCSTGNSRCIANGCTGPPWASGCWSLTATGSTGSLLAPRGSPDGGRSVLRRRGFEPRRKQPASRMGKPYWPFVERIKLGIGTQPSVH